MSKSITKSLSEIDDLIAKFENLLVEYPKCPGFVQSINYLRQKRADAASKIGRR